MTQKDIVNARDKIKRYIIEYLKKNNKSLRDAIFDPVLVKLGLTKFEMADKSGNSVYSKYKSLTGTVLNELVRLNVIHYEGREIRLTYDFDIRALKEHFFNKYLTEEEKKDKSGDSKALTLRHILNRSIKKNRSKIFSSTMEEAIAIIQKDIDIAGLNLYDMDYYPNTPLGNRLRRQREVYNAFKAGKIAIDEYEYELSKALMEAISIAGGEFFERLSLNLLLKVYGGSVISNRLTGGSEDNGIDSEIIVTDPLGFIEKIIVQAKTKYNEISSINVKVLREFIGVMTAYSADKGVLICNTQYHKLTIALSKKCRNLILIGKKELFFLMKKHRVGIIYDNADIPYVDDGVFLLK